MNESQSGLVAIYIAMSILIIAANLTLISAIIYSPVLRKRPRNHIIVSIALADLLLGCFVTPMLATTLLEGSPGDCRTHLAVQAIGDHGIFFVVGWELVTFNIVHIRENIVQSPCNFLSLPTSTCLKSSILTSWPWFAALSVLVPLITTYTPITFVYNNMDDVICMMRLPLNVLVAVCFFSLYLPYYLCAAALVTMAVCHNKRCHRESPNTPLENLGQNASTEVTDQSTQLQAQASTENPMVAVIPNAMYLVCYTPLIVHTWLHFNELYAPNYVYEIIAFGLLARSVLLPLSWVVYKDIGHELRNYESKLKGALCVCASNPLPSTASSVSFSRLQETQTV